MKICLVSECGEKARTKGLCNKHALRLKRTGQLEPWERPRGTLEERFWRRVEKTDGCWLWCGTIRSNGYGSIQEAGKGSKSLSVHRVSYMLHKGSISDGLVVMHSCDNKRCVNPDHLSVGTHGDNARDAIAKGLYQKVQPVGEANGKSKLTVKDVEFIRSNPDRSLVQLAKDLGVSPNCVRAVRIGRTWSHLAKGESNGFQSCPER